jgi:phosphosulfolactate synthase (CoM biosynthesis protein A)
MSDPPDIDPAYTVDPGAADINTPDTLPSHNEDSISMSHEQGTQQTKEAITGAVEFLKAATRAGADGFQISDARIVITDHEMRQAVQKAIEGGSQIDDEVADLSPPEGVDVAMHAVSEVRDILS